MTENNITWGVVELLGHLTLAGRITKPGEYGGLWQIDIPEIDDFRTEFFNSQSVYRIRITSEEIARAYAAPRYQVHEYDTPIVTREEHERVVERARGEINALNLAIEELKGRLVAIKSLKSLPETIDEDSEIP